MRRADLTFAEFVEQYELGREFRPRVPVLAQLMRVDSEAWLPYCNGPANSLPAHE